MEEGKTCKAKLKKQRRWLHKPLEGKRCLFARKLNRKKGGRGRGGL